MRLALVLVLLCSCDGLLTKSTPVTTDWQDTVHAEWAKARSSLIAAGVPADRIDTVQYHDISWLPSDTMPFPCGTTGAVGCYDTVNRTITWYIHEPDVLQHEIGHAILHILGYDCWADWEHNKKGGCP